MAFIQSPSVSNNPKIPTYYLIFAVNKSLSRKYTRILQITLLDIDPGEEMEVLLRLMLLISLAESLWDLSPR